MQVIQYLNEQGELRQPIAIPNDILLKGYHAMWTTRLIDERMLTLQRQGTITFAMSAKGEEACAVASAAALKPQDWLYPQYREGGLMFWRGATPLEYIHQMFGDKEDPTMGRQMPNHFGSREKNIVVVSSPIATQIPQAAGCAYAMKYQQEEAVAVCYFGEGATSEGDFHAGLNFAAVRKAPAIFFCRNNGYAISTPTERQYAGENIAIRGPAYGIQSFLIDGNDFFAVYETVKEARQHCLDGKGPVLIEANTFRLGAHSSSDDPSVYRQDKECEPWESRCPIIRLRKYLEKQGVWDAAQEEQLIQTINQQISDAIAIAKETPRASLENIVKDVYFDVPLNLQEQYKEINKLFNK